MKSVFEDKHFRDEQAAYDWVEARVWPEGPICPHCGGTDRISRMGGKSTRIGTYKCYQCRKPFTVKVGTIFESSHVPMRLWLQARTNTASSIPSHKIKRSVTNGPAAILPAPYLTSPNFIAPRAPSPTN